MAVLLVTYLMEGMDRIRNAHGVENSRIVFDFGLTLYSIPQKLLSFQVMVSLNLLNQAPTRKLV